MSLLVQPRPVELATASPVIRFAAEQPQDRVAVGALIDRAFGPGRFAKTAERLREGGAVERLDLSVCVWLDGALAGAVRLWTAHIRSAAVVFLGPIAVEKTLRHHGLGAGLVERACTRARQAGERAVILVGDRGFFCPLGFEPVPLGQIVLPGPVDSARVLWKPLTPGGVDGLNGRLSTAPPA